MNQVWLFFCIPNLLADIVCLMIHIDGSLHLQEPMPHNMIFCGTFAGFILIPLIRAVHILLGLKTHLYPQILIDGCGTIMHFLCALLSLHYAENDFHLIFMGPQQELDHHYFAYCKKQSVACIIAGALYLLQFVLILDFIQKTPLFEDEKPIRIITEPPKWDESYQNMSIEEHDHLARTQANVYLLGRQLDHWFRLKSKWFRQLAGGQELIHKSELLPVVKKRQSSRPRRIDNSDDDDDDDDETDDDGDFEIEITSKISSPTETPKRTKFDFDPEVMLDTSSTSSKSSKPSVRR
ncbi:uncharacterized protein LOC117788006 [Drosophila innubila]|uniref:uncharacterized protein LOC117788006 n=1 Tax=Drosophila innubila TaxID=198719 RepID=UPI00148B8C1D|nr:uncharacterized protein LOC117788006 [Drosophila innubila]